MSQTTPSTLDIKVFAVLGLIVMILLISIPILGGAYIAREVVRRQECATRSPLDAHCQPSRLWKWIDTFEAKLKTEMEKSGQDLFSGEEGDVCGGGLEIRCKPGFECQGGSDAAYGICRRALGEPTATGTQE